MIKIALFNHKGGVGKTTLTVNLSHALGELGLKVLLVDADPQCNLSSFYLTEKMLDDLLGASDDKDAENTIWSAIRPVVKGKGTVKPIALHQMKNFSGNVWLALGDVMLADYEEELPAAWTDSFARKSRGYDVMCAISDAVGILSSEVNADVVFFDVGPNVGALNRAILLDCDYFATPVAADLFSLRALTTVGRSMARWIKDWATVRGLASKSEKARLIAGVPKYLGYITSAFKVSTGRREALPHSHWEAKIAPRVSKRIVGELSAISSALTPSYSSNKIGGVKHFHSLAASAQEFGLPIGCLRTYVNSGHNAQIDEAQKEFEELAREFCRRIGIRV